MMEYMSAAEQAQIPEHTRSELGKQAVAHMYWRQAFFKATDERNPRSEFLVSLAENRPMRAAPEEAQRVPRQTQAQADDSERQASKNKDKSKNKSKSKRKDKKNKKDKKKRGARK